MREVTIDANSPLSGKTLIFKIDLVGAPMIVLISKQEHIYIYICVYIYIYSYLYISLSLYIYIHIHMYIVIGGFRELVAPSEPPPGMELATFAAGCFWGVELATNMYICMCIYIMYVCLYVCMYVCMYVYMYICICVYIYIYIYTYIFIHIHTPYTI